MNFLRDINDSYRQAFGLASRSVAKAKKQGLCVCPVPMNSIVDEKMISYRLDLGVLDVPVNLIVGVAEETEKTSLYTGEFLPVSPVKSKYADKWREISEQFIRENGFRNEIRCYEYLGRFYVSDGLMRVSVAKYHKANIICSQVIRVMPIRTESKAISQYYDFLFQFRLTRLYQLQFTQPGYFELFQKAMGFNPTHKWSDSDRKKYLDILPGVEYAFHKSFDDTLKISVADALVVLLQKYTFDQIAHMESWMLARIFQAFWKELYELNCTKTAVGVRLQALPELQTA